MTTSAAISADPYLSVVVTTRNDDHGGDPLVRLQAFVNSLDEQCRRTGLDAEIIIVEWNPPAGRPRLHTLLKTPQPCVCTYRFIEVPAELHDSFQYADVLPLFQMIAKNVGIRRARGRFVLATNIDIIFSNETIEYIASGQLRPGVMYRVDRHDIQAAIPVDGPLDSRLRFCEEHQLRVHTRWGSCTVDAQGRILPMPEDIVDGSTVRLGAGWHVREGDTTHGFYRWVMDRAEVHVEPASDAVSAAGMVLEVDLEPNPYDPASPIQLEITDGGKTLARPTIGRRGILRVRLDPERTARTLKLNLQTATTSRPPLAVFERRGDMHYVVRSIKLTDRQDVHERERFMYPPQGWQLASDGMRELQGPGADRVVVTAPRRWAYCLQYGPLRARRTGTYRFVVTVDILEGGVSLGVLDGEQRSWFPIALERVIEAGSDIFTVSIALKSGDRFWLMLSNDHPQGEGSSRFVVKELSGSAELGTGVAWSGRHGISITKRQASDAVPLPGSRELRRAPGDHSVSDPVSLSESTAAEIIDPAGSSVSALLPVATVGSGLPAALIESRNHAIVPPIPRRADEVPRTRRVSRRTQDLLMRIERRRQERQRQAEEMSPFLASGWRRASNEPALRVEYGDREVSVVTARSKWSYCLEYGPLLAPARGIYRFEVDCQVIRGGARLGVLSGDRNGWLRTELPDGTSARMSSLTASVRLKARQSFWLILYNDHPDGDGESALLVRGVTTTMDARDALSRAGRGIESLVARPLDPDAIVVEGRPTAHPLDRWRAVDAGATAPIELGDGWVSATTAAKKWSYCLEYGPVVATVTGTYEFTLSYALDQGAIAFGVLDGPGKRWLLSSYQQRTTPDGISTWTTAVRLRSAQPYWFVISNDHPDGDRPSRFTVHGLDSVTQAVSKRARWARLARRLRHALEPDSRVEAVMAPPIATFYPVEGWRAAASASTSQLTQSEGRMVATSARERWSYCLEFGPMRAAAAGAFQFSLAYELQAGGIVLGVLDGGRKKWLPSSLTEVVGPHLRTMTVSIALKTGELFWLVVSNNHPDGNGISRFAVHSLSSEYGFVAWHERWRTALRTTWARVGAAPARLWRKTMGAVARIGRLLERAGLSDRFGAPFAPVGAAARRYRDNLRRRIVTGAPEYKAMQDACHALEETARQLAPFRELERFFKLLQDRRPDALHLNGCGDFQMMAREHWFELRAYPEFHTFSMNIDGLFSSIACYAGITEQVLESPCHIYHIEHEVGSGWSPEGEAALRRRIAERGITWIDARDVFIWSAYMHWLRRPMIFNKSEWGLGDSVLDEQIVSPSRERTHVS